MTLPPIFLAGEIFLRSSEDGWLDVYGILLLLMVLLLTKEMKQVTKIIALKKGFIFTTNQKII